MGGVRIFGGRRIDARRLARGGQAGAGRIVGIRIDPRHHQDDTATPLYDYAVRVEHDEPFVAGVRHELRPDDLVRLGMEVAVRHDGARAVIDWSTTCGGRVTASQLLDEPPPEGIDDRTLGDLIDLRTRGVAGSARVEGVRARVALRGVLRAVVYDLALMVPGEEPRALELPSGSGAPFYAAHLPVVGATLPVWVDPARPDRPAIDWPAAAMRDPGIGRPPAPSPEGVEAAR
jgi:hypothetical protein